MFACEREHPLRGTGLQARNLILFNNRFSLMRHVCHASDRHLDFGYFSKERRLKEKHSKQQIHQCLQNTYLSLPFSTVTFHSVHTIHILSPRLRNSLLLPAPHHSRFCFRRKCWVRQSQTFVLVDCKGLKPLSFPFLNCIPIKYFDKAELNFGS